MLAVVEQASVLVGIVVGVMSIVGVAISVGRNSQKVTDSVDRLSTNVEKLDKTICKIDERVDNHETRLAVIERRVDDRDKLSTRY